MPTGLATNLAVGNYTVTWNNNDIGLHEGPIRVVPIRFGVNVRASQYGDSDIDGIYRGTNWLVSITLKEWKANNLLAMFPHESTFGTMGTIGKLDSSVAQALVLTAEVNTPAAGITNAKTYTFPLALVTHGMPIDILLDADERNIPLTFKALPDSSKRWMIPT